MGNYKVCCSAREQGKPYSKAVAVQHSRKMAARTALVFMILLFLALSFVCEGLKNQSPAATDGAESSVNQEAKVAPAKLRNRVHTILLTSRSELPGAIQAGKNRTMNTCRMLRDHVVAAVFLISALISPVWTTHDSAV